MKTQMRNSAVARAFRPVWPVAASLALLAFTPAWAIPGPGGSIPTVNSRAAWPLFFEEGPAQNGPATNYLARGRNYQIFVSPAEVDFALYRKEEAPSGGSVRREQAIARRPGETRLVRMRFLSADGQPAITGAGPLEARVNYLVGNDPKGWRRQVPTFSQVSIQDLYSGINVRYYGTQQQLEYDFTVAPHADPSRIALRFDGVDKLAVDGTGELVVGLGEAELRQHKPVIYQIVRGVRREVAGGYRLKDTRTAVFTLGAYDPDWPLIIDPVFSYCTFFGGNAGDTGLAIKVDDAGSVYLAGETLSTQWPAPAGTPFQSQMHGGVNTGDAFIAKLDNSGTRLLYFTYLGGGSDDGAYDLAIDRLGNAYVAGFTVSPDFPTRNALFSRISGTPDPTFNLYPVDGFVAELNTNGSDLVYSTYLGGSDKDLCSAIAVDPAGYTYVAGYTYSTNFPIANARQGYLSGYDDAFVSKISPGGKRLVYSTYLGGYSIDEAEGIAVDAAGYVYVSGYTASTDFPITADAAQRELNGSGTAAALYDAFAAKIAPDGQSLVYSTYLGGSLDDYGYRIAVDGSGQAYITGTTQSPDFPHTNAFNLAVGEIGTNSLNFDAFLVKLDALGKPAYAAQFGGSFNDAGWDVALDPAGRPFVIGMTSSTNFPVANPFDLFRSFNAGYQDIFVVAFETNPAPVLYSAYLGGGADDYGYAVAVDSESNAYLSGMTHSGYFPTTAGAFQKGIKGSGDAFVAKVRFFDPVLDVQQTGDTFQLAWPATAPEYVLQSTTDLSGQQTWTDVGQTAVLADGQYRLSVVSTNPATLFRLIRR